MGEDYEPWMQWNATTTDQMDEGSAAVELLSRRYGAGAHSAVYRLVRSFPDDLLENITKSLVFILEAVKDEQRERGNSNR